MLVLTRKLGEKVVINGNITLTVVEMKGNRVTIAFDAPAQVRILRGELLGLPNGVQPSRKRNEADLKEQPPVDWEEHAPCVAVS
jgi:carbon storage regulator CsrA